MILLFANNAVSTIASPINAAATSVQLAGGDGAKFPNPIPGQQFFKLTFVDDLTGLLNEIVHCTARAGDILTIVRAQEGTVALPWLAGDAALNMTTAGTQDNFSQIQQAQAGATNTAVDTGAVNSYVAALTPAVTTRIFGLFVRIKAATANTGASTLNIGAGSFPIINPDGTQLGANAIVAGGFFEVVDDGSNYQLISASQEAQSSNGVATTGSFQWRPTTEALAGWIIANSTSIGNAASNATQLASALAANLFAWHWNNFSNTQCPVFTSAGAPTTRGANAAADFAANKAIQTIGMAGTAMLGMDNMGGHASNVYAGVPALTGNAITPGSYLGEIFHALTLGEAPAGINSNGGALGVSVSSTISNILQGTVTSLTTGGGAFGFLTFSGGSGGVSSTGSTSGQSVTSNNTGGASHNTVDRGMVGTIYIKL
jgi:hypothetical protein